LRTQRYVGEESKKASHASTFHIPQQSNKARTRKNKKLDQSKSEAESKLLRAGVLVISDPPQIIILIWIKRNINFTILTTYHLQP
jgi:hypothetical protein